MELALTEDQERQAGRVWGMTFIGVRKKILVWANGLLARLRWPLIYNYYPLHSESHNIRSAL